jgi:branched-chain amino acid transport system ATP-binding protein
MNEQVPLLQVQDLSLAFGGVQAVAGLSLAVHRGEVLAVIGPNGAGKTSLLNAITRVFDVSGGEIRFKGQWWQQVLRTPALVRLEEAARAEVEAVIEFLDLSAWRNAPIAGLPYGVRKVVELGRALCCKPELLFLDEPASGLNPEETRELSFWIDDIRSELGITVVMVEHDMSLVSAVADRVICMAQGRLLAQGTPAQVQSDPQVIAAYLGA